MTYDLKDVAVPVILQKPVVVHQQIPVEIVVDPEAGVFLIAFLNIREIIDFKDLFHQINALRHAELHAAVGIEIGEMKRYQIPKVTDLLISLVVKDFDYLVPRFLRLRRPFMADDAHRPAAAVVEDSCRPLGMEHYRLEEIGVVRIVAAASRIVGGSMGIFCAFLRLSPHILHCHRTAFPVA